MSCGKKLLLLAIVGVLATVGAFFLGREIGAERERAIYSKQLYELTEGARKKANGEPPPSR